MVYNSNALSTHEEIFSLQFPKILLNIDDQLPLFPSKERNFDYILFMSHVEHLKNVLNKLTNHTEYNNHLNHLVVVNESKDVNIKKSIHLLWKYDIYNVVLAVPPYGYTWYPYKRKNKCGTLVNLMSFDMCSITDNPFSNKIPKSGFGCVLKSIWVTFPVFVQSPNNRFGGSGLVEMLIATLKKTMQVSVLVGNGSRRIVYKEHLENVMLTNLANAIVQEDVDIVAALYWPTVHHQIGKQCFQHVPFICVLLRA